MTSTKRPTITPYVRRCATFGLASLASLGGCGRRTSEPITIRADDAHVSPRPAPQPSTIPKLTGVFVPITLTWIHASTGVPLVPIGVPGFEPAPAFSRYEVVDTKHLVLELEQCATVRTPKGTVMKVQPQFQTNAFTIDPVSKRHVASGVCISFYEPKGSSFRWSYALCQPITHPTDGASELLALGWDDSKVPSFSFTEEEAVAFAIAHEVTHECR